MKFTLPKDFAEWTVPLQEKWIAENRHLEPGFDACECGCNRAQHNNSRGMCNGYRCTCTRFVKRTRKFVHMEMMRTALLVAIDELDGGRNIKVVDLSYEERQLLVKQMRDAIAGPKL